MGTFNQLFSDVASTIVVDSSNTALNSIFPEWVLSAEGRIVRELDLVAANVRDSSASTTTGVRNFNLPTSVGTFLIVTDINIITPASTAPEGGTRVRLTPVSLALLDWTYPSSAASGPPQEFAYITQDTFTGTGQSQIAFGPWPDNTYRVEVIGKIMPPGLTSTNTQTWVSTNLYDLLFKAVMIEATAWQMDFGASGIDNPQAGPTWLAQYETAKQSAAVWQARARFAGASWTSSGPEPIAAPQRG